MVWITAHKKTSGRPTEACRVYYRLSPGGALRGKVLATREAADRFAAQVRLEITSHRLTVEGAIESFRTLLEQQRQRNEIQPESIRQLSYRLHLLLDGARDLPLCGLTEHRAKAEYERLADREGVAPGSQHAALAAAKRWGAWLVETKQLKQNPFASVKKIGVRDDSRDASLRIDEARTLHEVATGLATGGDLGALATVIILSCSLRPNEVCKLLARDVDDGGRTLWIDPPTTLKTRNTRRAIGIADEALRTLLAARAAELAPGDRLVPRDKGWITDAVKRVSTTAGVPTCDARTLRRTFGRIAAQTGQSLAWIAAGLGHGADASAKTARRHYIAGGAVETGAGVRVAGLLGAGKRASATKGKGTTK